MYLILGFLFVLAGVYFVLKKKNMHLWLKEYIFQSSKADETNELTHILFCFVDHYEPQWAIKDNIEVERSRVDRWMRDYPELCKHHRDADGRYPQHSFFYPEEEYREEHLAKLASLCKAGYGEVEIHLHHDNDTRDNLTQTLSTFAHKLQTKHGLLSRLPDTNQPAYGFIHGNWSLCNSRNDGRWCGVNDELLVLKETGCYADFTFPSAPSETQTSKINSIYYAKDMPGQSKSHNTGEDVKVGGQPWGDLMIIQGPLALNWKQRKFGFMPRIEAGDIRGATSPNNDRVDLWVKYAPKVKGCNNWRFIKIHTHGTQEADMDTLLGSKADEMFSYLESRYNDGKQFALHYVSSREVYNIVKAAEAGLTGNPNEYRDYVLKPPSYVGTVVI